MILILDFYVDEPACFGVPPYLSPYCRYVAGALVYSGIPEEKIDYLTVDQWRENQKQLDHNYAVIFLITGTTVPGKYLGGKIGTIKEVLEFLEIQKKHDPHSYVIIGGPIRYADKKIQEQIQKRGGILIRGDIEKYAEIIACFSSIQEGIQKTFYESSYSVFSLKRNYNDVNRYAIYGSFLTTKHPNFPYLILELETYRGCTRNLFCSFCTEAFYGKPSFRSLNGIHQEVEMLYQYGNRYFRIGRQADLMTYLPFMNDFKNTFPRPNPESIKKLYEGIREKAPDLKLLHLDNINPGLIATYPRESKEIIKIICQYNTPGDTAAMGLESLDPIVIKKNDLKCNWDEAIQAIEIINEYGSMRKDGLPILLPGINLIHGLEGETEQTFEINYQFLKELLDRKLLIRRINIRQAIVYQQTKLESFYKNKRKVKNIKRIHNRFLFYRDKIRKEIDHAFLKLNFPRKTLIKEVILEKENPGYFLGRPLGSYPITIKIPKEDHRAKYYYQNRNPITCLVTGWEERSIQALIHPIDVSQMGLKAIENIPDMNKKKAYEIFLSQKS